MQVITHACHFYVSISFTTERDPREETNFYASSLLFDFENLQLFGNKEKG